MARRTFSKPAALFYSYAHEDEDLCKRLEHHLSLLQRQGLLTSWHNHIILPGSDRSKEIDDHLNQADLILLLVSANFLASDYCYDIEMRRAMERHQRGEARVIPIILRPCDWSSAPFGMLQALPRRTKPITTWTNEDEVFKHVAQQLRRLLEIHTQSTISAFGRTSQMQERMHQRLQLWYRDFLIDSLQQAAWLEVSLIEKPNALASPVSFLVRNASLPDRPLPSDTSIIQAYEQANQELLILGEPGTGKSTQLYTLAQFLLTRTETNRRVALPVVFALSSWALRQSPLETWMGEQLTMCYQVPKNLAQQWVKSHQILPLLDGLDEMEEVARLRCIQEINRYHQEHLHPLVVCCRSEEYQATAQIERLTLQCAIVIQPLKPEQVMAILSKGDKVLTGLWTEYRKNTALQELITTPLLLNLLILTYQGIPVCDLSTEGTALLQHVLHAYVERMIVRKGDNIHYPSAITIHWLSVLASQMRTHNLTEWTIEQLWLDWLPQHLQWCYRWSVGILLCGLLFELPFGLIGGLLSGLPFGLIGGLLSGLPFGLIMGLFGLVGDVVPMRLEQVIKKNPQLGGCLRFGVISGPLLGVIGGLIVGLHFGVIDALLTGLFFMATGGLSLLLLLFNYLKTTIPQLLRSLEEENQLRLSKKSQANWSKRALRSFKKFEFIIIRAALIRELLFGSLGGLVGGLLGKLINESSGGLLGGLIGWLIFGIVIGPMEALEEDTRTDRPSLFPTESLRFYIKKGLFIGLMAWLIFGLSSGLLFGLNFGLSAGLLFGLLFGLNLALFCDVNRLLPLITHITLRFWIWRFNKFPFRFVPFLEDARSRHFLKRVGGTYQFMHRLLLDHFADLSQERSIVRETTNEPAAPPSLSGY
jgi:hypothetical protein